MRSFASLLVDFKWRFSCKVTSSRNGHRDESRPFWPIPATGHPTGKPSLKAFSVIFCKYFLGVCQLKLQEYTSSYLIVVVVVAVAFFAVVAHLTFVAVEFFCCH